MFRYALLFYNADSLEALQQLSENSLEAQIYESPTKALRKLYKSGLSKSSPKAGWLLLEALQKQADFRWKHSQSRMTFVESSMVAIQKARKS